MCPEGQTQLFPLSQSHTVSGHCCLSPFSSSFFLKLKQSSFCPLASNTNIPTKEVQLLAQFFSDGHLVLKWYALRQTAESKQSSHFLSHGVCFPEERDVLTSWTPPTHLLQLDNNCLFIILGLQWRHTFACGLTNFQAQTYSVFEKVSTLFNLFDNVLRYYYKY